MLALVNRLAERLAARAGLRMVCFWLAAPRPRPTRAQIERWSRGFGWPLDHLPAPEGDLQGDETMLWHGITDFNERYVQRAKIFYINQFGWNAGELGALSPGDTTWQDFRIGTDIELDLAVYEPFGYTALESYVAGAVCVLSDACGSARHLENLGLGHTAVIGRFTQHDINPRDVDASAREHIEARVYDEIIDDVFAKLGVYPPADRNMSRELRLAQAQEALRRLSWDVVLRDHLVPLLDERNAQGGQ